MFLFGPNQPSPANNYRPELHDSNGLSIHAGNGEWIWRPLNNPKHLAVSSFSMENPQGFGLLAITGIDGDIRINKALWVIAEQFRKWKS